MIDVEALIGEVIGREGGYSNHPADRGGPTRWGVTQAVARAHGYNGDMQIFPREKAVDIYRRIYWTQPALDQVAVRFPRVAAELFDTGVNMGPSIGIRFLQRALNALNRNGRDYPDIAPMAPSIGPKTIAALEGFWRARGAAGESVLLKAIECQQGARYIELGEARPPNEAFMYGWLDHRIGQLAR